MPAGFSEILGVIADILIFLIMRTIDVICITLLIASSVLPWRLFENLFSEKLDSDWRAFSFFAFLLTLGDLFIFPLGMISLVSPLRWYQIMKGFSDYNSRDIWYFVLLFFFPYLILIVREIRGVMLISFCGSLLDICGYVGFILMLMFPTRIILGCKAMSKIWRESSSSYNDRCMELDSTMLWYGFNGALDVCFFLPGLLLTVIMPTLWYPTFVAYDDIFNVKVSLHTSTYVYDYDYDDAYWSMRLVMLSRMGYFFYDIAAWLFSILALLSPLRHVAFRLAMLEDGGGDCFGYCIAESGVEAVYSSNALASAPVINTSAAAHGEVATAYPMRAEDIHLEKGRAAIQLSEEKHSGGEGDVVGRVGGSMVVAANPLEEEILIDPTQTANYNTYTDGSATPSGGTTVELQARYRQVEEFRQIETRRRMLERKTALKKIKESDTYYNSDLRWHCIYYGSTALVDVFLLPILFPLIVTWYRWRPVKEQLLSKNIWGVEEFATILKQFLFLLFDMMMFPFVAILFITQLRWKEVAASYAKDDFTSCDLTANTYSCIIGQCLLLCLDVVTFPFLVFCMITWYRSKPIRQVWSSKLFHSDPLMFHGSCFANTFVILHDVMFIPIIILFLFITGYRAATAWSIIHEERLLIDKAKKKAIEDRLRYNLNGQQGTQEEKTNTSTVTASTSVPVNAATRTPEDLSSYDVNLLPTHEWRLELWYEVLQSLFDIPFIIMGTIVMFTIWRANVMWALLRRNEMERYSWNRHRRFIAFKQFCLLFVDILCLIPFALVVATLYRLPTLLLNLYSQCFPFQRKEPMFEVLSVSTECQELGGIRLNMKCRKRAVEGVSGTTELIGYKSDAKLFVAGAEFWNVIKSTFGDSIVSVAQSMLPLKLKVNVGICFPNRDNVSSVDNVPFVPTQDAEIAMPSAPPESLLFGDERKDDGEMEISKSANDLQRNSTAQSSSLDGNIFDMWVFVDTGATTKRTTVLKKLNLIYNKNSKLLLQIEATPVSSNHSPVVITITPTLEDFTKIFALESNTLPLPALNQGCTSSRSIINELDNDSSKSDFIQDSFSILVGLAFVNILVDIGHLFIAMVVLILLPWRSYQLIRLTCFPISWNIKSIINECIETLSDGNEYLQEYQASITPLLNEYCKQEIRNIYDGYFEYYEYGEEMGDIEENTIKNYQVVYKHLQELLKYITKLDAADYDFLAGTIEKYMSLQFQSLMMWSYRTSVHLKYNAYEFDLLNKKNNNPEPSQAENKSDLDSANHDNANTLPYNGQVLSLVEKKYIFLQLVYDHTSSIKSQEKQVFETIHQLLQNLETKMKTKKEVNKWGFWQYSTSELKAIVRRVAKEGVRDIGYILMTLMLVLGLVRAIPLLLDLYRSGHYNLMKHNSRRVILKHTREFAREKTRFFICLFYCSIVFITIIGIPDFLQDFRSHSSSLKSITNHAKRVLKDTAKNLCEFLVLIFACRSYYIGLTACVYSILLPPACIAEAIPCDGAKLKLLFGSFVYFGLIIGSIIVTVDVLHSDTSTTESGSSSLHKVVVSFYTLCTAIATIIVFSIFQFASVENYRSYAKHASINWLTKFSWSHIFALLTPLMECLQLSYIIMYFHWTTDSPLLVNIVNDYNTTNLTLDSFPLPELFFPIMVGVILVIIWGVLVSFPLAMGTETVTEKLDVFRFQSSPMYDFVYTLLSKFSYIWIIASLMRSASCVETANGDILLSTYSNVQCNESGGVEWGSKAALPLLVFYLISSNILNSDSADMLGGADIEISNNINLEVGVKYAPLYTMIIRLCQFIIVALCFGSPSIDQSSEGILIVIIVITFLMAIVTIFYPLGAICSLPLLPPLRASSFIFVLWTAVVTFGHRNHEEWATTRNMYIGYGVIFAIGVLYSLYSQYRSYRVFQQQILENGLSQAITNICNCADVLVVEDALGGTKSGKEMRIQMIQKKLSQATTSIAVCKLLLQLEQNILVEKLEYSFLEKRPNWKKSLLLFGMNEDNNSTSQYNRNSLYGMNEATNQYYRNSLNDGNINISSNIRNNKGPGLVTLNYQVDAILQAAETLQVCIKVTPPIAIISKHILAMLFRNHLPEYVAWEVFSYLYDTSEIVREVTPMLMDSNSFIRINDESSYSTNGLTIGMLWKAADNLKKLPMFKAITNKGGYADNSGYMFRRSF